MAQVDLKEFVNANNFHYMDLKNPPPLSLVQSIDKEPRYYQINGVNKLVSYIEEGFKRILYIMPTGTGKTLQSKLSILSKDFRKATGLDKKEKIRVLFIVHKNRLLRQAEIEYSDCEDVELITHSAFQEIPQSLINEGWDVTFIDEAHHEAMMSIQKLIDKFEDRPVIGFTANANRGDSLLVKFERYIIPITKKEAIEEGFIEKPIINTIVDTGKSDKSDLAIEVISKYHKHMGNMIVFFKTNQECEILHSFCQKNNLDSYLLGSSSTEKDLDYALDLLSNGKIQFLINCKKVDEGIDVLNCTDVFLARQFNTESEKEQFIGRAIRPDSPCQIWEFINPTKNSICADEVVGSIKCHRLLYKQKGEWHERIIAGTDDTWGKAQELRHYYVEKNKEGNKEIIDIENKDFSDIDYKEDEEERMALLSKIPSNFRDNFKDMSLLDIKNEFKELEKITGGSL